MLVAIVAIAAALGSKSLVSSSLTVPSPPSTVPSPRPAAPPVDRSRTEQVRVEVGYTRNLVIEDRRTVGDGTVSLATRTTVPAAKDVDG